MRMLKQPIQSQNLDSPHVVWLRRAIGSAVLAFAAVVTPRWAGAQHAHRPLLPAINAASLTDADGWIVRVGEGQELDTVRDEQLGRDVVDVRQDVWSELRSRQPIEPPYTIEALVRQPTGQWSRRDGIGVLRAGLQEAENGTSAAYAVSFQAPRMRDDSPSKGFATAALRQEELERKLSSDGRLDFSSRNGQDYRHLQTRPRFTPASISPIWPVNFRRSVMRDMASIPETKDQWQRIRIEVGADGRARLWHNSFVIADYKVPQDAAGHVSLRLFGPMQLAWLRVYRPATVGTPYITVPLDSVLNAKGFVDRASLLGNEFIKSNEGSSDSLLFINSLLPFELPLPTARGDHVDVGRSVFRYRLHEGFRDHNSPHATVEPQYLDPARIRLRLPSRPVTRVWVLAASDAEPNSVPIVTARFYRNNEGYPLDAGATVPVFTARSNGKAKRIRVRMANGEKGALWAVPIDINALRLNSEFRGEDVYELELAKEIHDFRAFPDPTMYTSYPAGLPSSVHVYALTLETAPFSAISSGNLDANIYTAKDEVVWQMDLESFAGKPQTVNVQLDVTGPDVRWPSKAVDPRPKHPSDGLGRPSYKKTYARRVKLAAAKSTQLNFKLQTGPYGHYTVKTTLEGNGEVQTNENTFVSLPPDTRKANGTNSRWGIYYWGGGHDTLNDEMRNMEIMHAIGSRTGASNRREDNLAARRKWNIGPGATLLVRRVPPWAREDPIDRKKRAAWQQEIVQKLEERLKTTPDLKHVSFFAESSVSLRLTHGMPPQGIGRPYYSLTELTDSERERMRWFYETAAAGVEALKKSHPQIKLDFGHASPLFSYPFFQHAESMGFDMRQFEAYGLDSPQFERMPERWPRATEPSLMYFSNELYRQHGLHDRVHLAHTESFFPPSHRLGAGQQGQAQIIVRTAAHALAWGTDQFESALASLYVPGDYWGTSHYGSAGMIGPGPEFDPMPAVPAYATMTQMLDLFEYDGWLDVGSRSSYAIRFKRDDGGYVYCCYTIRGRRPLTLTVNDGTKLTVTDQQGNTRALDIHDGRATATLGPAPVWIVSENGPVTEGKVGEPTYAANPGRHAKLLDDFNAAAWSCTGKPDADYAENHWDVVRELAPMSSELVEVDGRDSQVMRVTMGEVDEGKLLLRRYGVFVPKRPIAIPGKAKSLGVWVNGHSNWKRVIYEIEDAEGEVYQNVGTQDAWNCDDIHSWSHTNFDGWRFMEFPLPNNLPGDNYREKDSVWWGHRGGDGDGVVDLPIKLNKIIISMSTHQIYVDKMLPVAYRTIELDDLVAVYDSPEMMTDAPVKLQRAAADAYRIEQEADMSWLPNPIARLQTEGVGKPPRIVDLYPPEQRNTGRTVFVKVAPVAGARQFNIYVAADAEGRGAKVMTTIRPEEEHVDDIRGLQPNIPMYLWATYIDENGKESQPSPVRKTVLANEFPMD